MELTESARMLLRRMQSAEGHWISASEGRTHNKAVNELMDGVYATYGQLHSRDGIVLTFKGRNAKVPPPPKPVVEKKKPSTKRAKTPSTKPPRKTMDIIVPNGSNPVVPPDKKVVQVGGFTAITDEKGEKILLTRDQIVTAYCEQKGWDRNNLSMEQVLEIRAQKEWQDAGKA